MSSRSISHATSALFLGVALCALGVATASANGWSISTSYGGGHTGNSTGVTTSGGGSTASASSMTGAGGLAFRNRVMPQGFQAVAVW